MRHLFLKEVASYLKDARLYLGFIFIVLAMGVGGLLYGRHHQDSLSEYSKALAVEEEKVRSLSFRLSELAEEEFKAYRRPRDLQFVVDGEDGMRPNMIPYSTANIGNPEVSSSLSYQSRRYERLDWSFAVGVLATFLAVVMSFGAISGEKEEGTLKLLLTNRVARTTVLTAKLLALTVAVFFPVLVGALLSMALVTLVAGAPFSGPDLLRIAAVLSIGLILVLLFVSMGLFISALTGQSTKSLVLLLLVWVVSVVIIPSLGRLVAENIKSVVPAPEVERRIGELLGEALEEYSGKDISHAPREVLPVDRSEFLWDDMMDKVEGRAQEILDGNLRAKMDQVRIMEGIASISPVSLFRQAAGDIAGAGPIEDEYFIEDVRNEREELLEFLRSQDAQDPDSPHILYRKWYMSYKPVDPAAVPRYTGSEVPLDRSLRAGLSEAIALAAWAAVMFLLAHFTFQRMDAR
jgi:ABC-type transport system involved in multi-copper enzyme maturation permease subunit